MHEQTGFTMKTVDSALPKAFDLLADLLTKPNFDEIELQREQKVIIEEIKMTEDSPEELLSELFQANYYPKNTLGFSIAGTPETVKTFNHQVTKNYHKEFFSPNNLVISATGNIEHELVIELAEKYFNNQELNSEIRKKIEKPISNPHILLKHKRDLEQTHLLIATDWVDAKSEKRYTAHLLETIFGSGTSSRLWQKIREEKGLAYSVGASGLSFEDCGIFTIYAGTSANQFEEVVDLSIAEMKRLKCDGVTKDELNLAKEQTLATILLGLEDSGVRATNLAQTEIIHGRVVTIEETLQNIEKVDVEEIQEIAQEYFQTEKIALAAIGNLKNVQVKRERLDVN
jgi:predicted Zn-dependent peptidase